METDIRAESNDYFGSFKISSDALRSIESNLDASEKVSLIFLLYDDAQLALRKIRRVLSVENSTATEPILKQWTDSNGDRSKEMLIESLLIVKAYREVNKIGNLRELKDHFLPKNGLTSIFVHPIKKILFLLCEDLIRAETIRFVDWICKNTKIQNDENPNRIDHLETFMLELIDEKIIIPGTWRQISASAVTDIDRIKCDVSVVIKYLESVKNVTASDDLKSVEEFVNSRNKKENLEVDNTRRTPEDNVYPVKDVKSMGYFLIFNQKTFGDPSLLERHGTEKDVERLEECWKRCGFSVKVFNNLTSHEVLNEIEKFTNITECKHSAFGVCILSHGNNDSIYTSDGEALPIGLIKNTMISARTLGKPKILLVQACRGNEHMTVLSKPQRNKVLRLKFDSLRIDSPEVVPSEADLITFWATVYNYVAFRDQVNGSYFIQTVCKCILEHRNSEHLIEIFTRVNNEISKISTENCQISVFEATLRKRLYLRKI